MRFVIEFQVARKNEYFNEKDVKCFTKVTIIQLCK